METVGVGSIKKIFGRQREPYGFLTIHHPEELRGDEAVFYLKDVLVSSEEERRILQGGMMVKFAFTRKPHDRMKAPCPFKAVQVRVQQMNQTVDPGDKCIVSISWKEMVRSMKEDRPPVGTLVAIEQKFNSFFSVPNDPFYESSCNRCKHNSSLHERDFHRRSSVSPFGYESSIWSEGSSQLSNQSSLQSSLDHPWDPEWYLRTIQMAEMVLTEGLGQHLMNKQRNFV